MQRSILCCVSDGCLSSGRPFFIRNVSPTAYVPSSFSFFASGGVLFHIMFFASGGILFANSSKKFSPLCQPISSHVVA